MSLQIFILGVLSEGHHHPYDLKKIFKKNNIDEVSMINDGKLYYNFDSLQKKGCIEMIEVVHEEGRPARTVYGITDKGREVLKEKIYKSLANFQGIRSIYSSVIFIKYTNLEKSAYLLGEQVSKLKEKITHYDQVWEQMEDTTPPALHLITDYTHNQMRVDLVWLEKVTKFVQDGLWLDGRSEF